MLATPMITRELERFVPVENFYSLRARLTIWTLVLVAILATVVGVAFSDIRPGVAVFIFLAGLFLWKSLYDLSSDPIRKAIPMVRGVMTNILLGPGWIYCPWRGSLFIDFEEQPGGEFTWDANVTEMVPGDQSMILVPNNFYAMIDPENPLPIIWMGGVDVARKRLTEQFNQYEREWLCSENEGPQTMDDARRMGDEAILMILEKLLGDEVRRIHPTIPNEAIVGFLKGRPLTKVEKQLKTEFDGLTQGEQRRLLDDAQTNLIQLVEETRAGRKIFRLPALGLILTRFGIGNIEPTEETKVSVADLNKAKFNARVEATNAQSVREQAKLNVEAGIVNSKDAFKEELIRRKIVPEERKTNRIEVSPEILHTVEVIADRAGSGIAAAMRNILTNRKEAPRGGDTNTSPSNPTAPNP